ncbi:phospholipase D-like domain-containing protein [Saprospiraceae bacterium]|nr:phospholipase D-like domain-containing protein [Saprospiraceae bacterium]
MNTQAYFDNIQSIIVNELKLTEREVLVAVAWFTDKTLFIELLKLAKRGVRVELIINDDHINDDSSLDYNQLNLDKSSFHLCPNENLMHNKFAVIDNQTVVSGSYNWTNKAKYNHESITVVKGAADYANDYREEFLKIKHLLSSTNQEETINIQELSVRLDLIKNFVILQDKNAISQQLETISSNDKLPLEVQQVLNKITNNLNDNLYSEIIETIDAFTSKHTALTQYIDFENEALKLEINSLEFQISSIENEISEIERLIAKFHNQYNKELGEIILEILKLEQEHSRDSSDRKNYENFKSSYDAESKRTIKELNQEDEKRLKITFRKASKMCHPDIVEEIDQEKAVQCFMELRTAYEENDLEKVEKIYQSLKEHGFSSNSEKLSSKQKLKEERDRLIRSRSELEQIILELRKSESYVLINSIGEWKIYFNEKKQELNERLKTLK